jgi:hypothetical protein
MKSVIVCLAVLAAGVTSVDAHQTKKKVAAPPQGVCAGSSTQSKNIDCKATGAVQTTVQSQQMPSKPRLGFSGNPWIFSGF